MAKRSKLEIAQAWADITIDRWKRRMEVLEVGTTGELLKSFTAHITSDAAGDPAKITFAFLYYGRFPDMGVGRGVKLSDTPDPTGRRKIKPWYSDTFRTEVAKLGRMMAARFGIEAAEAISAFRGVTIGTERNDEAWYNLQSR